MYTVETYTIADWEEPENGLLIAENEEWILVKHIPVDFLVDGYRLYKKEFIEDREQSEETDSIAKVLALKDVAVKAPEGFEFRDTLGFLQWSQQQFGYFEFQDEDDTELFYGKIQMAVNDRLEIDMILSDGSLDTDNGYEFMLSEIRLISFQTDYFISMGLLHNDWLAHQ